MPGGVVGPFTRWYADGAIESHGSYVDLGSHSVPDGVWGFWYRDGKRRTMGAYRRGEPDGCFAVWDDDGKRHTGTVVGDQLHVGDCTPPDDDGLLAVEGRGVASVSRDAWGDVSIQGFVGSGALGARNADQLEPDPDVKLDMTVTARKRLGRMRFGPIAGVRMSDATDSGGVLVGAAVGLGLPSPHPRLDFEIAAEAAALRVRTTAVRSMELGTATLDFWQPHGSAQLGVAFMLSPTLEALAGFRVGGAPSRDVERTVIYCEPGLGCFPPRHETWQIGGFAYGASLGIRLTIR
jgi:hypothetical protein